MASINPPRGPSVARTTPAPSTPSSQVIHKFTPTRVEVYGSRPQDKGKGKAINPIELSSSPDQPKPTPRKKQKSTPNAPNIEIIDLTADEVPAERIVEIISDDDLEFAMLSSLPPPAPPPPLHEEEDSDWENYHDGYKWRRSPPPPTEMDVHDLPDADPLLALAKRFGEVGLDFDASSIKIHRSRLFKLTIIPYS